MNQDISFKKKNQLLAVKLWINWLNFWLNFFRTLLFRKLKSASKNILIYKIGNIGDIVCAVPAIIAIRKNFQEAKIALLTSPGKIEASGAKELLEKAWYVDELKVYYGADIDSWQKKKKLVGDLKKNRYDLFIQLPDDLANFRTLFRNMIFAKLIGVKSAFGFKIRTIQLFKKTQVDYTTQKTEVESLLDLLKENSIKVGEAEFDFNISDEHKNKVKKLLEETHMHHRFQMDKRSQTLTQPTFHPSRRLDYVLTSKSIKVKSYEVLNFHFSDHLPLLVDFKVK